MRPSPEKQKRDWALKLMMIANSHMGLTIIGTLFLYALFFGILIPLYQYLAS